LLQLASVDRRSWSVHAGDGGRNARVTPNDLAFCDSIYKISYDNLTITSR